MARQLQIFAFGSMLGTCFPATINVKLENMDFSQFGRSVVIAEMCNLLQL